ncbi:hypothetical protein SAMN05216474_0335 [Lishizhenia tianjinensis]|uniref:Uncharacterized protein n=1 Tax=Lishizhenia tianjinensis TaxID=477690 RepID=A0A1I6XN21_9FLAO|nr:hypothetical protein [Lishizhenia tianjinensis]SFT39788.1 hypothetical protein SAMN05216474_0335 [Lishizhenia tianjinensis]
MSLTKKKSRSITVKNKTYRYSISQSSTANPEIFQLKVTIQIASGTGSYLVVEGFQTRDFWLDASNIDKHDSREYITLTPADIAKFIHEALKLGWKPDEKGAAFRLNKK